MNEERYTDETIPMARIHLDKGIYTLQELQDIVAALEQMNLAAREACQPLEKTDETR